MQDLATRKFLIAVRQWHFDQFGSDEKFENDFANLFGTSRTQKDCKQRFRNLAGDNSRTTVMKLIKEEVIRIKDYLGWDYTTLIFEYRLGYETMTPAIIDKLVAPEGTQVAYDECYAA